MNEQQSDLITSTLPKYLIDAYRMAQYRVGNPFGITLTVGEQSQELLEHFSAHQIDSAGFITAFNPLGRSLQDEENTALHKSLLAEIDRRNLSFIEGEGADPANIHPAETSALIFGLSLEGACDIGNIYEQNAIIWIGPDAIPRLVLLR